MGYLQEIEAELHEKLKDLPEAKQKQLNRYIKEKILESYKNGLQTTQVLNAYKQGKFNKQISKAQ